jgi:hypothetical protein
MVDGKKRNGPTSRWGNKAVLEMSVSPACMCIAHILRLSTCNTKVFTLESTRMQALPVGGWSHTDIFFGTSQDSKNSPKIAQNEDEVSIAQPISNDSRSFC